MRHPVANRFLACLLSAIMSLSAVAPSVAVAQATSVTVENRTHADGRMVLSGVRVGAVAAPLAGESLDDTATVSTSQGATWDIPVLWVSGDLRLATEAERGETYLPVLAFYVPEDFALAGDSYVVKLCDSLAELFGGSEVVSVYNAATGITYILPASLRSLFAVGERESAAGVGENGAGEADAAAAERVDAPGLAWPGEGPASGPADEPSGEAGADPQVGSPCAHTPSLVDIYCAQTARDALTDEDLEWLIDLIVNKLEPQAVEALLDGFPAFRAAAENGEIGRGIGLYIYYLKGDDDGVVEHEVPAGGSFLAFVQYGVVDASGAKEFAYMLGVNVEDLLVEDANERPVRNPATGKLILVRDGLDVRTLENTLVHELFHVVMADYVRTGSLGASNARDLDALFADGPVPADVRRRQERLALPTWFIEGAASTVENIYQFRAPLFDGLRMRDGKVEDAFAARTLVSAYVEGKVEGKDAYYDLSCCDYTRKESAHANVPSAYVAGYLASLYLANLAAIKDTGQSAIEVKDGDIMNVSTERLRMGLSSIVRRMHEGETLDRVIGDISPTDDGGGKVYRDTADFQNKFIKGAPVVRPDGSLGYADEGDTRSSYFVADYLNYLNYVSGLPSRKGRANGSVLMPVDTDGESPLDGTRQSSSDYLKVVETNRLVASTVPAAVAYASGGKSDPDAPLDSTAAEPAAEPVATMAARQDTCQDARQGSGQAESDQTAGPAADQTAGPAADQTAGPAVETVVTADDQPDALASEEKVLASAARVGQGVDGE